MLIKCSVKK